MYGAAAGRRKEEDRENEIAENGFHEVMLAGRETDWNDDHCNAGGEKGGSGVEDDYS